MKVYDKTGSRATEAAKEPAQVKDQLQLSESAKDFQVAMKAFNNLPEIREEKVAELREKIRQGTYNVTGREVADKIIESVHINKKI